MVVRMQVSKMRGEGEQKFELQLGIGASGVELGIRQKATIRRRPVKRRHGRRTSARTAATNHDDDQYLHPLCSAVLTLTMMMMIDDD